MDSPQGPSTSELEQAHTAPQFGASTAFSEKLLAVAIRAQNFTGSTGVAIALTEGQDIVCRANWGTSAPEVGTRLSLDNSFTGLCVRTGEPLRCDDAETDPRVDGQACRALGICAIATAPIRRGVKVIGVIAAFSDTPKAFTEKHLLILTTLSEVIVELLDTPEPAKQSPAVVETASAPPRAAGVAQARFLSLGDKATIEKTVVGSRSPDLNPLEDHFAAPVAAAVEPAQPKSEPVAPVREPVASATASPKPPLPSVAPLAIPIRTGPAQSKRFDNVVAFGSASDEDILPAAMDPVPQPVSRGSVPSLSRVAPSLAATRTFTFGSLTPPAGLRRWIIPAAILAAVVIALVSWRLISASRARHAAMVAAQEAQPAVPAPPPQDVAPPQPATPEPQQSSFSAPPAGAVSPPAKAKTVRAEAEDTTVRRAKDPVVEAAGSVRRLKQIPQPAAVAEATPPQLALSTPELPTALTKALPSTVTPPVSHVISAQLLSRVEPIYPEAARRMRVSGKVVVKATISRKGTVSNVRWISGSELFHDSTITAVRQWQYKPATLNGQPVESDLEIVLQFNRPN